MKIGVLLSGCGVYDGSEIHEAVCTLLAIARVGGEAICIAPDVAQRHVIDHTKGVEAPETRNVLVESARIARGAIRSLSEVTAADFDGLALPGGFGVAKNLCSWAFDGPGGTINPEVQRIILEMVRAGKPIAALCMAPAVVALALKGSEFHPKLTVGTTDAPSPYPIADITEGLKATGAQGVYCGVDAIVVDEALKIISSPCYMMEVGILEVQAGAERAIERLARFVRENVAVPA